MLGNVKTSITRDNLRKGCYVPNSILLLTEAPIDSRDRKRHYRPAVELLSKMYGEGRGL